MNDTQVEERQQISVLSLIERGKFLQDIEAELRALTRVACDINKPTTATFTVKITPKGLDQVEFDAAISNKVPRMDRERTLLYKHSNGDISPRSERQMGFDEIEGPVY